ncbi:hypothetical protein RRG08_056281 [Elysia crispata]|uniref:Uncharacterized protein n=1 Tax=Elysia crispata TaxID=231223 RepID=A0AAE1AWT8_9GAST|nr:hypothetical protein RRG08_056281 [Elysia crispata]
MSHALFRVYDLFNPFAQSTGCLETAMKNPRQDATVPALLTRHAISGISLMGLPVPRDCRKRLDSDVKLCASLS